MAWTRPALAAAVAAAAAGWIAIAIGTFQPLYLTIHFKDTAGMRAFWTEAPYRRVPGLRPLLIATEERTSPGDRVLLWTPHRPWQGGYGYAYRRAQYVLAGREVIPLLDRARGTVEEQNVARATYIACWRACPPMPGFRAIWSSADGMLLRRVP